MAPRTSSVVFNMVMYVTKHVYKVELSKYCQNKTTNNNLLPYGTIMKKYVDNNTHTVQLNYNFTHT